jgi:hypothetical protein
MEYTQVGRLQRALASQHHHVNPAELQSELHLVVHVAVLQVDDSENFGPSLSKCPKLHMFNSYKVRALPEQCRHLLGPFVTGMQYVLR